MGNFRYSGSKSSSWDKEQVFPLVYRCSALAEWKLPCAEQMMWWLLDFTPPMVERRIISHYCSPKEYSFYPSFTFPSFGEVGLDGSRLAISTHARFTFISERRYC